MNRKFECSLLRKAAPSLTMDESVLLADILDATPCDGCEDKQRAIDALNAYVERLHRRGGARKRTDREFLEHRTEELTADDFASVYFDAQDIACRLADELDAMTTAYEEAKEKLDYILKRSISMEEDGTHIKPRHIRSVIVEGISPA